MNGHHIKSNTSCKYRKQKPYIINGTTSELVHHLNRRKEKPYIMNGHYIRLNTSSKHKKTKTIYYERAPHQIEYIIQT